MVAAAAAAAVVVAVNKRYTVNKSTKPVALTCSAVRLPPSMCLK